MSAAAERIPEAWPLLLSKEQACAFLGGVSEGTFDLICPVAPVDLGVRVLRWRRPELEQWISTLPARLPKARKSGEAAPPAPEAPPAGPPQAGDDERRSTSIERARARARKKAA